MVGSVRLPLCSADEPVRSAVKDVLQDLAGVISFGNSSSGSNQAISSTAANISSVRGATTSQKAGDNAVHSKAVAYNARGFTGNFLQLNIVYN